jgi:hypothetical protein
MSAIAPLARHGPVLRVALVAADPIRRKGLMAIIRGGGHTVVEHDEETDVVLVDGDCIKQYGTPTLTLGGADSGQAGALPADATVVHSKTSMHGHEFLGQ